MYITGDSMNNLTVAQAREQFADLLNRAAYSKERIVVMRHNKKVAALVPIEDLEALEAMEDQIDVAEARRRLAKPGKAMPWEKVKESLTPKPAKRKTTKKVRKRA